MEKLQACTACALLEQANGTCSSFILSIVLNNLAGNRPFKLDMTAIASSTQVTSTDRLGMTLFLATILHGIVILGVSFKMNKIDDVQMTKPLDVVLVHTRSDEAPDRAKKIAQFNQQASGSQLQGSDPSSPVSSEFPMPALGLAATPQPPRASEIEQAPAQKRLHTRQAVEKVVSDTRTQPQKQAEIPKERELRLREMRIAQLAAELEERQRRYAERPKIHFIDASSAKSAVEARYVDDWVQRVEAIGNLNYPEKAKKDRISGKLILNVLLDNDGSVLKVQIAVSSGSRVLDEAAVQIVKLSSPFPAFPKAMREKYDQLMITRTWQFDTQRVHAAQS